MQNGTFLIRPSASELKYPYALVVHYNREKPWNLRIGKRQNNKFAIGSEKADEQVRLCLHRLFAMSTFYYSTLFTKSIFY